MPYNDEIWEFQLIFYYQLVEYRKIESIKACVLFGIDCYKISFLYRCVFCLGMFENDTFTVIKMSHFWTENQFEMFGWYLTKHGHSVSVL